MKRIYWIAGFFILILLQNIPGQVTEQLPQAVRELEKQFKLTDTPRKKLQLGLNLIDIGRFPAIDADIYIEYAREVLHLALKQEIIQAEAYARRALGHGFFRKGNYQNSLQYYLQARKLYEDIHDSRNIGTMNYEIGNLFLFCLSYHDKAIEYYQKALLNYRQAGDIYNQVKTINLLGKVQATIGQYEKAAEFYIQAMQLAGSQKNPLMRRKRAVLMVNLSDIYFFLGDYSQSRDYLYIAENIYRRDNLQLEMASVLSRRGDLAFRENNFESALEFYFQALELRSRWFLDNSEVALEMRKIAEAYSLIGEFAEAEGFFSKSLVLSETISDIPGRVKTLLALGIHKQRRNLHEEARLCFQNSLDIAEKNGLLKELHDAALALADYFAGQNEYEAELQYRKTAAEIAESIRSPSVSARVMKTLQRYEHEEILKSLTGKRRRVALIAVFLLVLFSALIFYVLFLNRRAKQAIAFDKIEISRQESQMQMLKNRLRELENTNEAQRYISSKLSAEHEQEILGQLIRAMEEEKLFLDSELNIQDLTTRLNVNRTYLSQTINNSTGKNFSDFMNRFRVEEAKRLIALKKMQDINLLEICFESGFNNKTVFNRAFKKATGMTPSEFRKKEQAK